MRKLRLRKGTGPCSRSQGAFPAEAGLEARLPPDGNTLFSTHQAGSHPWPPTTGSSLSRSCIPDGPPPSSLPTPSSLLWKSSGDTAAFSWPPRSQRRIRKMKTFLGKTLYEKEAVGNVEKRTQLASSKWWEGRWWYLFFRFILFV